MCLLTGLNMLAEIYHLICVRSSAFERPSESSTEARTSANVLCFILYNSKADLQQELQSSEQSVHTEFSVIIYNLFSFGLTQTPLSYCLPNFSAHMSLSFRISLHFPVSTSSHIFDHVPLHSSSPFSSPLGGESERGWFIIGLCFSFPAETSLLSESQQQHSDSLTHFTPTNVRYKLRTEIQNINRLSHTFTHTCRHASCVCPLLNSTTCRLTWQILFAQKPICTHRHICLAHWHIIRCMWQTHILSPKHCRMISWMTTAKQHLIADQLHKKEEEKKKTK